MALIEERLKNLNIKLPPEPKPAGSYISVRQIGNLLFLAGTGPADDCDITGKLGADISIEKGKKAAESAALNVLSKIKYALGDLDRVARFVKVVGFVASTPEFYEQPEVINAASDLFIKIFGDEGRHARTAVSTVALPWNIPVELDVVIEVKP